MAILLSVSNEIHGYSIIEHKDFVLGVGSSVNDGTAFRGIAIKRAAIRAANLGANALLNIHLDIHQIGDGYEATAYGNAVYVEVNNKETLQAQSQKANLEAFIPKPKREETKKGEIIDLNGYKFVVCPKCKSKYKANIKPNGEIEIKGFEDIDDIEPGVQIVCVNCSTKFTVPDKI